jgi:hypothetical protein
MDVSAQVAVTLHDITNFINRTYHEHQKVFFADPVFCRQNVAEEGQAITSTGCVQFPHIVSPQRAHRQLTRTDLPELDNELLPLLDLSSPSLSSNASIVERFDAIAEHLFRRSYLVCCSIKPDGSPKRVLYELLEFEFYLIKVDCHSDPFTHDGADQRLSGAWSVQSKLLLAYRTNQSSVYL